MFEINTKWYFNFACICNNSDDSGDSFLSFDNVACRFLENSRESKEAFEYVLVQIGGGIRAVGVWSLWMVGG